MKQTPYERLRRIRERVQRLEAAREAIYEPPSSLFLLETVDTQRYTPRVRAKTSKAMQDEMHLFFRKL